MRHYLKDQERIPTAESSSRAARKRRPAGEPGTSARADGPAPRANGAADGPATPATARARKPRTRKRSSGSAEPLEGFSDIRPLASYVYLQLAAQAAELAQRAAAARGGADAEAVHRMRVTTRRVRSALRTFRAILPDSLHAAFYGELRWLAATLGQVRDLDVYRERYVSIAAALTAEDAQALARHEQYLQAEQQRVASELAEALDSERCRRLLNGFAAALAEGPPAAPAGAKQPATRQGAAAYISRAKRRVLKRGGRIGMNSPPKRLHALRIRIKRFRYLLEFFMPLYAERLERALRAAIRVQDVLGVYQDVFTATARLRRYAATVPADEGFRDELLALGEVIAAEQAAGRKARKGFVKEWPAFKGAVADLGTDR